jgi:glycosyltransferase involved in cell wall biosynthesis
MKRRITVLYPIAGLPVGGTEQQLLELVKAIDKRRFRPIVLNLNRGGPLEPEFREVPGVRVISLKRNSKYDFFVLLKIFAILRRMNVDVIQPFVTPATFFGLLPAIMCRTPVKIVTERSGPGRKKGAPLGYRLYLLFEDALTRFADSVVANSNAGKRYLLERGINPALVMVIYNGINLRRLSPDESKVQEIRHMLNLSPGGKVIGMMASLTPIKNHATFLQAAALISRVMPDTRFALVGDGPLRGHLECLSRELALASKLIFFGDQQDVGSYLSALDIAVLSSDAEGCSNFLLEAMALGKPVVATDVGANRELILHGRTGLLVPPGDAEALADAVITLIRDEAVAKSIGQRAKDRAITQFGLENMVHQYESLYYNTIKRKAKGGKHESFFFFSEGTNIKN